MPQPPAGTTLDEAARLQEQYGGGGAATGLANGGAGFAFPPAPGAANGAAPGGGGKLVNMQRRVLYSGVLQRLRGLMVNRMAKPEVRR